MDGAPRVRYSLSIPPATAAVVVAVEPAPPSPELGAALVKACSIAARPRECVLATDPSARRDATVRWESPRAAQVEVQVREGSSSNVERALLFRPEDRDEDKWSAAGLVVAALVEDADRTEVREPARSGEDAREPAPRAWVALGGLAGRGLERGPVRYGGWLRLSYRFADLPMFVVAEVAASRSGAGPEGISPGWMDASLGFGGHFELQRLDLVIRPRLDGVVERQSVARDGPPEDSGSRLLDGLRFSVEGAWPSRSPVSLVAGVAGQFLSGATATRVGGRKVSSFPAGTYAVLLGVEVAVSR